VLGLGEVGLPSAEYIADKGIEVYGYDIKQEAVEKAKARGVKASADWQEIPVSNVYIICVYASIKNAKPDFSSIFDVCEKIKETLSMSSKTCLMSIESTVMPGLCSRVYKEIFRGRVNLVHVPHRYWAGDPLKHGVKQRRVIGAINDESLKEGWNFYNKILGIPLHKVSSIEIAEMSKITENAYRYIQIAFAEELKMMCEKLGMNFNELRDACNTKWNIEIPEARDGIRGHCIPKDMRYFTLLTKNAILTKSAMLLDEAYQKWMREKVSKR
jgi:nucleotide sugar dehydrogenase